MKKTFTFWKSLFLLFALIVGSTSAWADQTYSLTPNQTSTGSSATSYITTLTEFTYNNVTWKMNQWNPSTLQVKTNQNSAASEFRFYNTSAFPARIKKVVIKFSALTLSNTSNTGFMFVGGSSSVTATTGGTAGIWNSTDKTITWEPGSTDNFTYFAFYQNGKVATQTNNLASEDAIVVTYEDPAPVLAPSFNPSSSAIKYDGAVEISCNTEGASIYYTIGNDPADPTTSSTLYTTPIHITDATTIKAIAVKDNNSSTVSSASYTIKTPAKPVFSLPNGEVAYNAKVALSQADDEMIIYTTDGTAPSWEPLNGAEYTGPIALTNGMTVKAIAIDGAENTSSVATATYTFAHGATMNGNVVTFDFSKSGVWMFPTDYDKTEKTYTADGYTITFGASNNGHKVSSNGIIMGKEDATITLPAFNFKVTKIKVYGQSNSSGKVTMNIFVGNTAVSTAATSSLDDHEFAINSLNQDLGTRYVYKVTNDNNAQITKIEVTGENTTSITSAGYSTFVTLDDTDFAGTAGVTAYKVINATNSTITLEPISAAPAGTPVVLKGSEATYTLAKAAITPASIDDNLLQVGGIIGDGASYYVLGKDASNNFGFGLLKNGVNLPATKAYLPAGSVAGAKVAFIPFDIETTAIDFVVADPIDTNAPMYNLAGQRVNKSYKGVVIQNGKKVVRK